MSLQVKQIKHTLMSMFEKELDLSDIGPTDSEKEIKILSRCLAALAVYNLADCTVAEAASGLMLT